MKKRDAVKNTIILLLIAVVVVVSIQFLSISNTALITEAAVEHTMFETITCNGILGMDEQVLLYDGMGFIGYTVEDGARVSQGQVVANVFSTQAQTQMSAYEQMLRQNVDTLEKSQITAAGTDMNMLVKQTQTALYSYVSTVATGDLHTLSQDKADLWLAVNKEQIVAESQTSYAQTIANLTQQINAAAQTGTQLTAGSSGYFVSGYGSYAGVYNVEQLNNMTPQELYAAASVAAPENDSTVAGKIISDYKWNFFASVTAQEAEQFNVGATVNLAFVGSNQDSLPAQVQSVTVDEATGYAKVVLSCNYMNADVVKMQHTQAIITLREYSGLKINKEGVRNIENVNMVYVLTGNIITQHVINVIYEDENYVLVPLGYESGANEVERFDEVIISGRDIYEGRLL